MRRTTVRQLYWLLLLVATGGPGFAASSPAPVDLTTLSHRTLAGHAEFLVASRDASLEEVREGDFRPLGPPDLNRGITSETVWLRLRLENPGPAPAAWVLHHETSYLDEIVVWARDDGGAATRTVLTDRRPFSTRPVPYRKLAYAHSTPAGGQTELYLRLSNAHRDSMTLRFHLWERERFQAAVAEQHLLHGGYYGIMIALMVITLVGGLVLRSAVYFHYLAYLVLTTLAWAAVGGFAFQYLWPDSVFWHNEGIHIIFLAFAIAALEFSKHFLRTYLCCPRVHPWLIALQLIMVGGIVLRVAGVFVPVVYLSFAALLMLVLLPALGWMAYRQGMDYARWYALAWILYSFGLVVSVLSAATGWLRWGLEPVAYAQAASLAESLLLLAALAERLRHWDRDRKEALRLASFDPLTGLGNRRLLTESLETFRKRFAENGLPVFLLMIDLDRFKAINDTYGHDAGDAVLRDFGNLALRMSRTGDVCTRYGGEEFALLFQAPTLERAVQASERIRTTFANSPTEFEGECIAHTLSGGLATVISEQEQLSVREMMARADAALYHAKSEGRNRTQVYECAMHVSAPDRRSPNPSASQQTEG